MRRYANAKRYGSKVVAELMEVAEQSLAKNIRKRNAEGRQRNKKRKESFRRQHERPRRADVLSIRDYL